MRGGLVSAHGLKKNEVYHNMQIYSVFVITAYRALHSQLIILLRHFELILFPENRKSLLGRLPILNVALRKSLEV